MPYVYLLNAQSTKLYKIGMTDRSVKERLKEINGKQSPFPIILVKSVATRNARFLEKELHQKFAKYRKHNEWFELDGRQLNAVKRAMDNKKNTINLWKIIIGLFVLLQASVFLQQCEQPRINTRQIRR